jgi:hypothetical protein
VQFHAIRCHSPYGLRAGGATVAAMSTNPTATVTRARAAEIMGIAHGTLRNWASATPMRGPTPTKTGTSKQARTLYALDEVRRWQADPVAYEARRRRSHRGPRR